MSSFAELVRECEAHLALDRMVPVTILGTDDLRDIVTCICEQQEALAEICGPTPLGAQPARTRWERARSVLAKYSLEGNMPPCIRLDSPVHRTQKDQRVSANEESDTVQAEVSTASISAVQATLLAEALPPARVASYDERICKALGMSKVDPEEALNEIDSLRERVAALEKDAERQREIEHRVWHLLEDSEQRDDEIILTRSEDYAELCKLLPEDHPRAIDAAIKRESP